MAKKTQQKEQVVQVIEKGGNISFSLNNLNDRKLWGITIALAVVYSVFSMFSDGFFMHDEPMFYMYAKNFLQDPIAAFKGFQRIGYVTFLALPALGGFTFLNIFNSVLCSITVLYSYKIIRKLKGENSFLIFFLLGLQPLWFMLAFRNYSEFFIAFLLVMMIWNHLNKRYIFAALLLSYAAISRVEYHTLLGFYFIVLIVKKQWLPALLTGLFTILENLLGFMLTDDILYLPNQIISYSERMSDSWPKRGFNHYFDMSNVIFGGVTLTLFLTYLSSKIIKRESPVWIIIGGTLFVIIFNCLLNLQSFEIGPGNAGNLRYLLPIAPFIAILGVLAVDDILKIKNKYLFLIFLVPFLAGVGIFQTYDHNFISLLTDGERLWLPLVIMVITSALIVLPLKQNHYFVSISLLSIFVALSSVRTFNLNPEDLTMKKAGKWYVKYLEKNKDNTNALFTEDSRVACSHILFYHFTDMTIIDFNKKPIIDFTKEDTDSMKVGDLVVWESHYGYRPKLRPTSQTFDFYEGHPDFEKIQYYQSKDNRFLIAFFRKIRE